MTTQAESLRAALRAIHYQTEGLRRRHEDGFITDWECDACGTAWPCETEAALAATPPTAGLDVERLTKAMCDQAPGQCFDWGVHQLQARAVAQRYVAEPPAEETESGS